jgi:hypothetical protein
VGVTDMADLFAFSPQKLRKLLQKRRDSFPLPLHKGRSSLRYLADVLDRFDRKAGALRRSGVAGGGGGEHAGECGP